MKRPRTQKTQRQNHCVLGGDGGESNSPSKRSPAKMYYKLSPLLLFHPLGRQPATLPEGYPISLRYSLSASETQRPGLLAPDSPHPGLAEADEPPVRRLVRTHVRLLLIVPPFNEGRWRLGLQSLPTFSCRTRASPANYLSSRTFSLDQINYVTRHGVLPDAPHDLFPDL